MKEGEKMRFNEQTLKELKDRYNKAVKNKEETFDFKGATLVTNYAKYLIEYLEGQLK